MSPVTRTNFALGFKWEISARFPRWETAKDPGDEFWRQIRETKENGETQNYNFAPIITSGTLI